MRTTTKIRRQALQAMNRHSLVQSQKKPWPCQLAPAGHLFPLPTGPATL